MALSIALAPTAARVEKRDSQEWAVKEKQLLDECHPWQLDFVLDPGRRVVARVGRGGGKTTGVCARFVRCMGGTQNARCLYVATTRDQAVELLWEPLKKICDRLNIPAVFNETKLRCKFLDTGSTIRLVGADNKKDIEKYRGIPFHEVWIDEAASYPIKLLEHLIKRIIGPRLGDFGGMLGLVGTPGHTLAGVFYEASRPKSPNNRPWKDRDKPGYENWIRWSLHHWTLEDAAEFVPAMARLWEEALVEKEANGWTDKNPIWLREYMGQWAADDTDHVYRYRIHDEDGNIWNQWDPEIDPVTKFAKLPEDLIDPRFCYGFDFGSSDATAINIFAYSMSDPKKRLFHVYGFSAPKMYLRKIGELLIGKDPDDGTKWPNPAEPKGLIGITGWPAGAVADPQGLAGGYVDELREVYKVRIKLANQKKKHASIESTNGGFIDRQIFVMKDSDLETELLTLQWDTDDYGQVTEDPRQSNDNADTLIYIRREVLHLIGATATEPKPPEDNFSPYSKEIPRQAANNEFGSLLGNSDMDDYWG